MKPRGVRTLWGAAAASVATFVAFFSHIAGGGQTPGWIGIVAPLVLATMVCTLLAGRRLSLPRLALSVGVSQLLFHGLFGLGTSSGAASMSASQHMAGHHGGARTLLLAAATHVHSHAAMWVGHGIAAIVTTAAIYFAARIVVTILALAGRVVSWMLRVTRSALTLVTTRRARPVEFWPDLLTLPLGLYQPNVRRRGPPLALAL